MLKYASRQSSDGRLGMKERLTPKKMLKFQSLFKALGDLNRIRLFIILAGGDFCVRELQENLQIIQPSVSRHLQILKEAGLVNSRRDEKRVYYSLNPDGISYLRQFPDLLETLKRTPDTIIQNET
jgi:DNA-binding transcriptional ArsR family regulator